MPSPAAAQYAQNVTVTIPELPTSVEEFVSLSNRLTGAEVDAGLFESSGGGDEGNVALAAFGGAAAFVVAGILYSQDAELGLGSLTVAIHADQRTRSDRPGSYSGFLPGVVAQQNFRSRWGSEPYLPRSYVLGTSPENGYSPPQGALQIRVHRQARDRIGASGHLKLFVHCTGADSNRPITLLADQLGRWKAVEWSSLEVGCRPPVRGPDPRRNF